MARLLLFTVVVFVFYCLLKSLFRGISGQKESSNRPADLEELVQDPNCRTYIAKRLAIQKKIDGKDHYFCTQECLKQYIKTRQT
jgi:uncharacterized protein